MAWIPFAWLAGWCFATLQAGAATPTTSAAPASTVHILRISASVSLGPCVDGAPLRKQALTRQCFPEKGTFNPKPQENAAGDGSDGGFFQDVDPAGRPQPDHVGQPDPGAVDLAPSGLAPEVVAHLPDVGDAGGGDGMALRLQAARHVDGGRPVPPGGPGLEEVDRPAFLAQHEVVVVDELGGGEAVVQLDEVEVLRPDAGLL